MTIGTGHVGSGLDESEPRLVCLSRRPRVSKLVPMTRTLSQRDMMRELYRRAGGDEERAVVAYAAAERRGEVERRSNSRHISPEDYARRLLADGLAKGWLGR